MSIKLETNIRELLTQCEELIKDNNYSWRLKKYIKSLDDMIKDLENANNDDVDRTQLENYYSRCGKLKLAINYIESPTIPKRISRVLIKNDIENDYGDSILQEINQMRTVNDHNSLRKELLGTTNNEGIRKRTGIGQNGKADMGQAMKYYGDMQEKIAEEMLMMTRSLREQTETANTIIKKDTEIVSSSAKLSDRNFTSLTNEAEKLQDHSKRAWKCWMWLMIAIVMVIFVCMVLFMKVMKKKTA